MASPPNDAPKTIDLGEEVEGDQISSRNYRFSPIGKPVCVEPGFEFNPETPPTQPLAVSEIFRLLFVANSHGFCVARTKEVMAAAEEIQLKGGGRSIQDLSIVDVSIGKVSVLALSADDSVLAASVGRQLHFFAVSSLLHKDQAPSFSLSIDDSSSIVDMRWTKRKEKAYVVLSLDGKLYRGSGQGPLWEVMDNVDAVDWSVKGDFIAVARKNVLSVFSPQLEEKLSLLLSFKSLVGDPGDDSVIKVDSIRWVRSDCLVVGCLQLNGDGEEENYLVQVISSKEGKITDVSSKPIVLSFNDVFLDYQGDALPSANGPHLFLSYLDNRELAFAVNRKNQQQHVVLLGWAESDKKNEAVTIEIADDAWVANIEPQGNEDDNLVLGLSIDRVSQKEEVKFVLGEEETEASPCCIVLCLTIDGKVSVFHFASARGAAVSLEASGISHEEDFTSHKVPSEYGSSEVSLLDGEQSGKQALQISESHDSQRNQLLSGEEVKVGICIDPSPDLSVSKSTSEKQEENHLQSHISLGVGQQKFPLSKLQQDSCIQQVRYTGQEVANLVPSSLQASRHTDPEPVGQGVFKKDNPGIFESKYSSGFFSVKEFNEATSKNLLKGQSTESPKEVASTGSKSAPPLSFSSGASNSLKIFGENSSLLPSSAVQKSEISDRNVINFAGHPLQDANSSRISNDKSSPLALTAVGKSEASHSSELNLSQGPYRDASHLKVAASPLSSVNFSGRTPTTSGNSQPLVASHGSKFPSLENICSGKSLRSLQNKESSAALSSGIVKKSERNSSKQYHNIEEMAKKLDKLLEGIEGKGGFKDASIAAQESLVVALEEGIRDLSHKCRILEGTVDEQLREIEQLLDKTVQVLSRKVYMEGILKQASDSRYWGLWNRQKLNPELELKRCHIVELDQELTNQLIKLERHFNSLELSRFGENGGLQVNRRPMRSSHGQSRHIQSLHSLHNTMTAQLAAAEQLSECLSKQMAVLNIDSPVKKKNIKKELFDTIGLSYDDSSYCSPCKEKAPSTPSNKELLISPSFVTSEPLRRNQTCLAKSYEPETARRRRDSLDRTWVSFLPPKTTVKRMLLQDDPEKMGGNRSFRVDKPRLPPSQKETDLAPSTVSTTTATPLPQSSGKDLPDIPAKQSGKSPSNVLFQWAGSQSVPLPTSSAGQNSARGTQKLSDDISKSTKSFTGKTDFMAVGDSKLVHHSVMPVHQVPSNSTGLHTSFIQGSNSTKESVFTKSTRDMKQIQTNADSLPFSFKETSGASLSPLSAGNSTPIVCGKGLDVETSTSQSRLSPSTIDFSSALVPSSISKPSEPKLFSEMTPNSKTSWDANQRVVEPQASVPSVTFSSNFSFAVPKSDNSYSFPSSANASSESLTSVSKLSDLSESKKDEVSARYMAHVSESNNTVSQPSDVSEPKGDQISTAESSPSTFSTKSDNVSTRLGSVQQPVSVLKSETSVEPTTMQQATSLKTYNEISGGGVSGSIPDMASNAKIGQSNDVEVPSLTTLSSETIDKNVISDAATNEDEMEEEAPETSQTQELTLGSLGGFGIGTTPNVTHPKPNPFGVSAVSGTATMISSPFTVAANSGELFRPASFAFQSLQLSQSTQTSQPTGFGAFSAGLNTGNTGQSPAVSGFGQPAQIGSGQKALGSVLGAFGQSRQIGAGLPGSANASASGFTSGFSNNTSGGLGGGFTGVASTSGFGIRSSIVGGFSSAAPAMGGFAGAAPAAGGFASAVPSGGGFSAAATAAGGFAAAAKSAGGFAAVATGGGGFAAAGMPGTGFSGGFGAFGNQQGGGGFSSFGSSSGAGRPPSELLTQMRK